MALMRKMALMRNGLNESRIRRVICSSLPQEDDDGCRVQEHVSLRGELDDRRSKHRSSTSLREHEVRMIVTWRVLEVHQADVRVSSFLRSHPHARPVCSAALAT